MTKNNQLQVEAIKNGTVIDHIPAHIGIKVLRLFKLDKSNQRITIGLNLPSSAMGSKDLLKIENVYIDESQAQKLALYAPKATVNQIEDYQVTKKLPLTLPEKIVDVFDCANSNCISHNEPVASHFSVSEKKGDIRLKCLYCEKTFSREIMKEKK